MSEVVEFKDQKYTWEDISGKGKCLVPYKPRITAEMIKSGAHFKYQNTNIWVLKKGFHSKYPGEDLRENKWFITGLNGNMFEPWSDHQDCSIEEMVKFLNSGKYILV